MPNRMTNDRLQYRHVQLLLKDRFQPIKVGMVSRTKAAPTRTQEMTGQAHELLQLWEEAEVDDQAY